MKPRTRSLLASLWMLGSAIALVVWEIGDAALMWAVVVTPAMLIMPWSSECCSCGLFKKSRATSDAEKAVGSGVI